MIMGFGPFHKKNVFLAFEFLQNVKFLCMSKWNRIYLLGRLMKASFEIQHLQYLLYEHIWSYMDPMNARRDKDPNN